MTHSFFTQKMIDCFAVNLCNSLQLDYVQPTFSKLAFRDERVRLAKLFSNLFLQKTGIVPCFYQSFHERLVSSLVCRIAFVHKLRLRESVLTHSPKSGMLISGPHIRCG
jgi:hypothetical protein